MNKTTMYGLAREEGHITGNLFTIVIVQTIAKVGRVRAALFLLFTQNDTSSVSCGILCGILYESWLQLRTGLMLPPPLCCFRLLH